MTSTNGVTLEGDDITKILSKLEASLKAKAEEGEEKGKASPEPGRTQTEARGVALASSQPLRLSFGQRLR